MGGWISFASSRCDELINNCRRRAVENRRGWPAQRLGTDGCGHDGRDLGAPGDFMLTSQKDHEASSPGPAGEPQLFLQGEEARNHKGDEWAGNYPSIHIPPPTSTCGDGPQDIPPQRCWTLDGVGRQGSNEALGSGPGPPGNPPVTPSKEIPSKGGHRRSKTGWRGSQVALGPPGRDGRSGEGGVSLGLSTTRLQIREGWRDGT